MHYEKVPIMADFIFSFFSILGAALIVCTVMCGIWVIYSIRKSFTSTLVFDIVYTLTMVAFLFQSIFSQTDSENVPYYLITCVTFFLDLALTTIILIEWRDAPERINEYILWLKIAVSILGVYTIFPLALYYLKLSYLPRHETPPDDDAESSVIRNSQGDNPVIYAMVQSPVALPVELSGKYLEWEYLGKGGFARVFRVKRNDGMFVALKIPIFLDEETGKTFIAELQNWTGLVHENIVRVCDFNILPLPYFEMELCDGSLVEEDTPMNPVRAVSLISDICEGLGYCHENNIIHRDLKPSNILFKNGTVKISDWGLSKVLGESKSTTSQISFSPGYAAPEQIMGTVKDVRTDIWQVGVIFYELVTGMLPFSGETLVEVLSAIATRDPEPPSDLAKGVLSIEPFIMKCLKKDPSERYQAASELRDDLNAYLQSTYSQMLDVSRPLNDRASSAHYYSQLLLLSLKTGDRKAAYTYAEGLTGYLDADKKSRAAEIARETARIMQDTSVPVPAGLLRSVRQMIRDLS
jgi:hypothetical protein